MTKDFSAHRKEESSAPCGAISTAWSIQILHKLIGDIDLDCRRLVQAGGLWIELDPVAVSGLQASTW